MRSSSSRDGIADGELHHEPVELRLGQRIGALLLDRVLRGQHEERLGQHVRLPRRGHGVLLHRLEQRGLGLRRRAVDLVGQHDVREDRPVHELEEAPPGAVVLLEQLGAGDVARHQVGGELHARELEVERLGDGLHEQRLREAGHADEQRVAAREDRGDEIVHDVALADDAPGDLRVERGARAARAGRAARGRGRRAWRARSGRSSSRIPVAAGERSGLAPSKLPSRAPAGHETPGKPNGAPESPASRSVYARASANRSRRLPPASRPSRRPSPRPMARRTRRRRPAWCEVLVSTPSTE